MTFKTLIESAVGALNTYIIPLLVTLVFIAFLWGLARYFIIAGDEAGREKGRQVALWGLFGIVALVALWGIVNLLLSTLNLPNSLPTGG